MSANLKPSSYGIYHPREKEITDHLPHMLKPFTQSPMQCLLFPLRKQSKPKVCAMTQDSVGPETPGIVGREQSLVCGSLAASGILQPGSLHFRVGWSVQSCVCCQPSLLKAFIKQIPKECCQDTTISTAKIFFLNHFTAIVWRIFSISAILFAERRWQPWRDAFVNIHNSLLAKARTIPFPYLREQLNDVSDVSQWTLDFVDSSPAQSPASKEDMGFKLSCGQ